MKLWSGRFTEDTDKFADGFNSSLPFDKRLIFVDILGSVAHATMLGKCGIILEDESKLITATLSQILADIKSGKTKIRNAEDVHSFVEKELTARIGSVGKKVHTGRSRNDQVALDMRLYMRGSIDEVVALIKQVINVLIIAAESHLDTVMPAFTHLQKAQPTTLAHHLLAYAEMLLRDVDRFNETRKRVNVLPLGSGACTSTPHPIDREFVAKLLEFPKICYNSMDGVSDRDFVLDYLYTSSVLMMHLSRLCEEYIMWASDEYKFIEISDKYSTGSSIMPQKKNPDMFELIRGKTGRTYGSLVSVLTTMKALPLAYNKDMQEDKEAFFNTEDTVTACLKVLAPMLDGITYNAGNMRKSMDGGYLAATECADYLTEKGLPFRDAHEVVGKLVRYAIKSQKTLPELSIEEYRSASNLFETDIFEIIKPENSIAKRRSIGSPSKKSSLKTIYKIRKFLQIN